MTECKVAAISKRSSKTCCLPLRTPPLSCKSALFKLLQTPFHSALPPSLPVSWHFARTAFLHSVFYKGQNETKLPIFIQKLLSILSIYCLNLKRRICSNEVLPFERAAVTYPACLHAGGGRIRSRRCRTGSSYPFHCYRARQEAEVVEQGLYRFGHLRRDGDAADAARGAAERERGNRQTDEGPRQA